MNETMKLNEIPINIWSMEINSIQIAEKKDGIWLFDFSANHVVWFEIKLIENMLNDHLEEADEKKMILSR